MKVSAKTFARISPPKAPEPPPITNADVPKVVSEKLAGVEQPKAWRFDVIRDENGLIKSIDARPADG
jgi:hypothetical protein